MHRRSHSGLADANDRVRGEHVAPCLIHRRATIQTPIEQGRYFTLKSHRQINVAKHEVLQEMERELPASPYSDEWYDKLNEGKTYKPIGAIALYMPWIFSAIYIAIVLLLLTD